MDSSIFFLLGLFNKNGAVYIYILESEFEMCALPERIRAFFAEKFAREYSNTQDHFGGPAGMAFLFFFFQSVIFLLLLFS